MTISKPTAPELPPDRKRKAFDVAGGFKSRAAKNTAGERQPGLFAGLPYSTAADFDDPLPESFWAGKAT
jgi:hypothetical protein